VGTHGVLKGYSDRRLQPPVTYLGGYQPQQRRRRARDGSTFRHAVPVALQGVGSGGPTTAFARSTMGAATGSGGARPASGPGGRAQGGKPPAEARAAAAASESHRCDWGAARGGACCAHSSETRSPLPPATTGSTAALWRPGKTSAPRAKAGLWQLEGQVGACACSGELEGGRHTGIKALAVHCLARVGAPQWQSTIRVMPGCCWDLRLRLQVATVTVSCNLALPLERQCT
jgi:hypothetical protein